MDFLVLFVIILVSAAGNEGKVDLHICKCYMHVLNLHIRLFQKKNKRTKFHGKSYYYQANFIVKNEKISERNAKKFV